MLTERKINEVRKFRMIPQRGTPILAKNPMINKLFPSTSMENKRENTKKKISVTKQQEEE